jgi:hypothetical protein
VESRQSLRSLDDKPYGQPLTRPWRAGVPAPHKQGHTKPNNAGTKKGLRGLVGCGGWFLSDVFGRDSLFGGRGVGGVGGVEGVGEGLRVRGAYSGYVVPAHLGVQGSGGVAGRAVEEEAGRRDRAVGSEGNG